MGRYAIISNGMIENIIVADEAFSAFIGAVEVDETATVGEPLPPALMTTEEALVEAVADIMYQMDLIKLGLTEV